MMSILFALATTCQAPIIELPATGRPGDRFAVMLTGDGGWRRIDKRVTDGLRAEGIPIVGFLASSYFRTRRTPEESSCALAHIVRSYKERWNKAKVILIGYSRGADVLPFMINRLSRDVRDSIQLVALLGLEPSIDFEYEPTWTFGHYMHHHVQYPVLPEAQKMRGMNVLCIYGVKEKDTLCTHLDPLQFKILREPGGHHFAGRYSEVTEAILNAAR
ncbi:MAG TPA: AcvB/VirJ family lysyl-phosphatidylglycerol hydrolase [Thermoanaerobaculia bacterium]|nr:AcvB/VirJ family lysyl-phosphatidylglycerol hydrolase [Thermoanaerobaculia bacterium]